MLLKAMNGQRTYLDAAGSDHITPSLRALALLVPR